MVVVDEKGGCMLPMKMDAIEEKRVEGRGWTMVPDYQEPKSLKPITANQSSSLHLYLYLLYLFIIY